MADGAKRYLTKQQHVSANRIFVIDGGFRDTAEYELFFNSKRHAASRTNSDACVQSSENSRKTLEHEIEPFPELEPINFCPNGSSVGG